tara:strand:+ start:1176 stop:3473 length:2298 start_codon:yes stop_codon:yes gene_type:complete
MASIISSLFGVGQQQQQQPAAQVIQQQLPKEVAPFYEKLLKESEALYKQQMEEGAPIYEGKTIAGFTPEQEQLFSGLQGLVGQQAPKFAEAEALTRGTAAKITPDEVQEFMNPYQQAVVDIEKREAQKQYESTVLPQLAAQAVASQGFGGSRQAILEGMAADTQQRLLADIQAKGSAQAYKDAMDQIAAQRQREGAAGQQLAQLAPAGFQAQAQELGAIGKVGDVKQQQAQLALDEAYKQFLQERQFPADALKQFQSVVQQFPNIPTQITRTPPPAQPGLAQTLLGGLGTAVGTYGAFGGFSPGGFLGMKQAETGGGIADLPVVYRQSPGRVRGPGDMLGDRKKFLEKLQELSPENIVPTGRGKRGAKLREEAEDKKGLTSLNINFDPTKLAFIGPGLTDEGETVGVTTELDDTGKEDMSKTRVDTFGQPSEEFTRRLGFEPLPEESQANQPGSNIDAAKNVRTGVLGQLDKQRGELDKLKVPGAPDTTELDRLQAERRKAKEAKITDIDKRLADIPEERKKDLFALLAQQSAKFASTPGATLSEAVGGFTKEGRKIFKASEEEKKRLKEQQTNINIGLFDDDVAQETARVNLKTKAEQNKFDNIIKKRAEGTKLTNAEINFENALANKVRAKAALKSSEAALIKAGKSTYTPFGKSDQLSIAKLTVGKIDKILDPESDSAKEERAVIKSSVDAQREANDLPKLTDKQFDKVLKELKGELRTSKDKINEGIATLGEYAAKSKASNPGYTNDFGSATYIVNFASGV